MFWFKKRNEVDEVDEVDESKKLPHEIYPDILNWNNGDIIIENRTINGYMEENVYHFRGVESNGTIYLERGQDLGKGKGEIISFSIQYILSNILFENVSLFQRRKEERKIKSHKNRNNHIAADEFYQEFMKAFKQQQKDKNDIIRQLES